jgi:hypothetical protein
LLAGGGFGWYSGLTSLVHPRFHPFEIVVLLVAARYGFVPGTITAILASLGYYSVILYRDGFSSFFPQEFSFLWPSVFLFSGMVIGDFHDDDRRKLEESERQRERERQQMRADRFRIETLETALLELEKRFLLQPETVSTLYDVARSINTSDLNSLPAALLSALSRFVGVESAGVYRRSHAMWTLSESFGSFPRRREIPVAEGMFGAADRSQGLVVLQSLLDSDAGKSPNAKPESRGENESLPLFVLPVRCDGQDARWLIAIEKIPFQKIVPETFRMLEIIADWAGTQLSALEDYEETKKKVPVDPVTGFFQQGFFLERAKEELRKARRYKLPVSLLEITFGARDPLGRLLLGRSYLEGLKDIIPKLTRDIDIKGVSSGGEHLWFVFPVTERDGAFVVAERFRSLYMQRKVANLLEEVDVVTSVTTYEPNEGAPDQASFQGFLDRLEHLGRNGGHAKT